MIEAQTIRQHWEQIYQSKTPGDVSWTQESPEPSLSWIRTLPLDPKACIVDSGGGRSALAECLVEAGHTCIEVFDISMRAMAQAKSELRSPEAREAIQYRVCDVLQYTMERPIGLWHDRAVFHFLTDPAEVEVYVRNLQKIAPDYLLIGTFSTKGPEKCSGLPVRRYSPESLAALFREDYVLIQSDEPIHHTPSGGVQAFSFVLMRHRNLSV